MKGTNRFPDHLSSAISRALWGADEPSPRDLETAAARLKKLWPSLALGRGQQKNDHYSFDSAMTEAYAAYYLPANLLKISAILEEAAYFGVAPKNDRVKWLDVGCGPGTAFWGAAHGLKSVDYLGLDRSKNFTAVGDLLARNVKGSSARFKTIRHQKETLELIESESPDVVSFMNSVSEIETDPAKRVEFISGLIEQLAKRADRPKWLIFVEPGSKAPTRELLELREALRSNPRVRIQLPCLDVRPCGALARTEDWCHEEIACDFPQWMDRLGDKAGLRKESMIFSYLVCTVGKHPENDSIPRDGIRVVSQRFEEKGLVRCFACTQSGKIQARVLRSKADASNEEFLSVERGQVFKELVLDEKTNVQKMIKA